MSLHPSRQRCRSTRFRPQLEILEGRSLPACTITQTGTTLTILGSAAADHLIIGDDGSGDISVVCEGMNQGIHNNVNQVIVRTLGGNDFVRYELLGNVQGTDRISVDLGKGADNFLAFLNNFKVNPNANYSISVVGAGLPGKVRILPNVKNPTHPRIRVLPGVGFAASIDTTQDPNTTAVHQVSQGLALPTLATFSFGAPNFNSVGTDIGGGGTFAINVQGSPGNDRISLNYVGSIQGNLAVQLNGGAGNDTIGAVFDATPTASGRLTVRVLGDAGNDDLGLAIRVEGNVFGGLPSGLAVSALVDGGAGSNSAAVTSNVVTRNSQPVIIIPATATGLQQTGFGGFGTPTFINPFNLSVSNPFAASVNNGFTNPFFTINGTGPA